MVEVEGEMDCDGLLGLVLDWVLEVGVLAAVEHPAVLWAGWFNASTTLLHV